MDKAFPLATLEQNHHAICHCIRKHSFVVIELNDAQHMDTVQQAHQVAEKVGIQDNEALRSKCPTAPQHGKMLGFGVGTVRNQFEMRYNFPLASIVPSVSTLLPEHTNYDTAVTNYFTLMDSIGRSVFSMMMQNFWQKYPQVEPFKLSALLDFLPSDIENPDISDSDQVLSGSVVRGCFYKTRDEIVAAREADVHYKSFTEDLNQSEYLICDNHTDYVSNTCCNIFKGLITLAPISTVPGLEVLDWHSMKWEPIEKIYTPYKHIVVFVGELGSELTGRTYVATRHQVVQDAQNDKQNRVSIPFLMRGRSNAYLPHVPVLNFVNDTNGYMNVLSNTKLWTDNMTVQKYNPCLSKLMSKVKVRIEFKVTICSRCRDIRFGDKNYHAKLPKYMRNLVPRQCC